MFDKYFNSNCLGRGDPEDDPAAEWEDYEIQIDYKSEAMRQTAISGFAASAVFVGDIAP